MKYQIYEGSITQTKSCPSGILTYGITQAFDAYKIGITAMTSQSGHALTLVK